ncbi:terpenoid synthase [Phlegmacium glaucopus]|nr:terpenoid synthase [Phlegmacium glaucopus]
MFSLIQLPNIHWIPKDLIPPRAPSQFALDTIQEKEKARATPDDIRGVITELLSQCDITYYRTPYAQELHDACIEECKLKNYPIDNELYGRASILDFIPCGVVIASAAYGHIKKLPILVYISLYTAFLTWVDDAYTGHVRGVDVFNERFITGEKQENEGLDGLARLLRETSLHYYGVQANIILTSSLNFMTSTILEFETKGMPLSPDAKSYTTFLRVMTGICEAYGIFAFPPEVPVIDYIQAIPEICLSINYFNDVMSFYKEELIKGEIGNFITNESDKRGERKLLVFKALAHDLSICVSRITNILEGRSEAKTAFRCFVAGYVSFHASYNVRYHLDDLFP